MTENSEPSDPPADIRPARRFQPIWLIPIIALLTALYLAYAAISSHGPAVTLTFRAADGLKAGQTKVRHKAVDLGTVDSIRLSSDLSHVVVTVQMQREASAQLTDKARFWVVRPRLNAGNISGLDTLVSGAYIEMDPGSANAEGAVYQTEFKGLDEPPAVRSDEPGTSFTLTANRIGGLTSGSPILYRDITVGEVLGWELNPDGQSFIMQIFVRQPYDSFVHDATHFWNASGVAVELGADGVQLHIESLQAVLSGAVAFDTDSEWRSAAKSAQGAQFHLYSTEAKANEAGYTRRMAFMTRFTGSVRGLAVGAPVEVYGIQVGTVTGVKLVFDQTGAQTFVEVRYEIQPERILSLRDLDPRPPIQVAGDLVRHGLRAQLHTASYVTGQLFVGLDFMPAAPSQEASQDSDGTIIIPGVAGGLDSLAATMAVLSSQVAQIPFAKIGNELDATLHGINGLVNGPELRQSLASLAATLKETQALVQHLDTSAAPALKRLPEIAESLQTTLSRTAALVQSAETGYGAGSQTRRDLDRLIIQMSDTARSVRLLADFLTQHPEGLIQGRSAKASEK
jgi:paraquat-inducible protein B